MSIELRLPGETKDADDDKAGVGVFSKDLGVEVLDVRDVRSTRGRGAAPEIVDAEDNDILELGWEGGIVELVRVGDLERHFPQSTRGADDRFQIPTRKTVRSVTRGSSEIELDTITQIRGTLIDKAVESVVGFAFPKIIGTLEAKNIPQPGLHRIADDGTPAGLIGEIPANDGEFLILIHGTFSSTVGGFKDLFASDDWQRIRGHYADRILALEQHTVTESPAGNALQLVAKLPEGAGLHLLSHSRGGIVGDLLCREQWDEDQTERFFSAPQYVQVRDQLAKLRQALDDKGIEVKRFARVAAPAAGTLLASERLDTYLNVILSVVGKLFGPYAPAAEFIKAIAIAIVSSRTRADALPGLEAMMPHLDKGFVPFLNSAEPRGRDLAVIAGDVRGGGIFDRVKDFFSHLYYREDNDFVVDSRSMFRGAPREEAFGFYYRAPRADHFSYFAQEETRSRIVEWLVDGKSDRFSAVDAAEPYGGLRSGRTARSIPSLKKIEEERRVERPVVFLLPGIMGTHLARGGDRQWINIGRIAWGGIEKLAIDADTIEPDGIVDMVYEKLFDRLRQSYDVIPFGYDWRRPIRISADLLALQIKRELDADRNRTVRIVGHSMGGLVSRAFIARHPALWDEMTRRAGRLIMLGTPNYGSYVPAQVFTQNHKLMKLVAAADLRNSLKELTDVVSAFPGLVEMLPYRGAVNLLDISRWGGFGDTVPNAATLEDARRFRDDLDSKAIDPAHMVYVAGHAPSTPASMELVGAEVRFLYTSRGDGTVPWDLGLLDGVDTYYVDAEHGNIPKHEESFDGFLELLAQGATRKLDSSPPAIARGAGGEELFVPAFESDAEEIRYYPDAVDLMEALGGRQPDPEKELGPALEIEITNADVCDAKYPVLVGHYTGDPIVSAEAALDAALGNRMSRDLRLGRYPGPLESVRVYERSERIEGAIVVGLGDVGELRRLALEGSLAAALMEFALSRLPAAGKPPAELRVSSLLIGTFGGARITIEDSISSLVDAALSTNRRLCDHDLLSRVRVCAIEFVELYRDIATEAGHAARRVAERRAGRILAAETIRPRPTARGSRPYSPYGSGWNRRLRIRSERDRISYEVTTDLARSEPLERCIQWGHVDSLLDGAMENDAEAPPTLFHYLFPQPMIRDAANMPDMVLDIDAASAGIPWELLEPAREIGGGAKPLGVRVGLLRTLSTPNRGETPRRASTRRALVIGEPAGVEPALPNAREEVEHVARLLDRRRIDVGRPLVGASAEEILRALYRHEYDIIHIAAHGEFDERDLVYGTDSDTPSDKAGAASQVKRTGIVLGNDRYLTSCEFENLRAVPSIVFLNCCHLAKTGAPIAGGRAPLRYPGRAAASLSQQLIEMGVSVVVAAGWAVGDAAAKQFAHTLYSELLDGINLMQAVRVARERTYEVGGVSDLTWGAYQVYGDPGYVLPWAGRRGRGYQPQARRFVSCDEAVEYVLDFVSRGKNANAAQQQELRDELQRLELELPKKWMQSGEIANAFGTAYGELALFEKAIEHYEKAVRYPDAPIKAIEQLANFECRAAVKRLEQAPDDPDARKQADEWFDRSQARLQGLCESQPSSERYSLIGATLKRRAKAMRTRKERLPHIRAARDAYEKACHREPDNLYYPLSNRVALDLSLRLADVDPSDIDRIEASARASDDEWARHGRADAVLLRFLATGDGTAEQVARAYEIAFTKGAGTSKRERDSILAQISTLTELVSDRQVRQRLESVRQALPQASST